MWNPVTGCTKVSPGCAHCYAERLAARLRRMGAAKYARGFEVALHRDALDDPLRWARPRLVFVNSMSDLFHPDVPDAFLEAVFRAMNAASRHTFQVLTKSPECAAALDVERVAGRERGVGAVAAPLGPLARDGVPFFFKQWGGTQRRHAGRTLDGRIWDELPPGDPRSL